MADDGLRQAAAVNPGDKFELVFKHMIENLFVERMDQNEEIFVRFMNHLPFQKFVTERMAPEAYTRFRSDATGERTAAPPRDGVTETQPTPQIVQPHPEDRYVTCVPLVALKAAAGAFSDPQSVEDDNWEWVAVDAKHRLRPGMFVNLEVLSTKERAVLLVPATAVLFAPFGDSVYAIEEGKDPSGNPTAVARQKFVRLGERRGDFVEVLSGLSAGEVVVSGGAFKLRNGAAVVVRNEVAPKAELDPKPTEQ